MSTRSAMVTAALLLLAIPSVSNAQSDPPLQPSEFERALESDLAAAFQIKERYCDLVLYGLGDPRPGDPTEAWGWYTGVPKGYPADDPDDDAAIDAWLLQRMREDGYPFPRSYEVVLQLRTPNPTDTLWDGLAVFDLRHSFPALPSETDTLPSLELVGMDDGPLDEEIRSYYEPWPHGRAAELGTISSGLTLSLRLPLTPVQARSLAAWPEPWAPLRVELLVTPGLASDNPGYSYGCFAPAAKIEFVGWSIDGEG